MICINLILINFLVAICSFCVLFCEARKIIITESPECKNCHEPFYYVKATGSNDTLHYIWDFTNSNGGRKPSLFLALTDLESNCSFQWTDDGRLEHFQFKPKAQYSTIVIFDQLIEFDDVSDSGRIVNTSFVKKYDFSAFKWLRPKHVISDENLASVEIGVASLNSTQGLIASSMTFQIAAFGSASHDPTLPRLLHSSNSTQVKIAMVNLLSSSGFLHSRWGLSLVVVSNDPVNQSIIIDTRKNIDDENSPGVFSIVNVLIPRKDSACHQTYLQWRPVVYTAVEPSIANSSDASVIDPTNVDYQKLNQTLAALFFRDRLSEVLVQEIAVTFGASQDGFYKKTNYTSWTFLMGYGTPEQEGLSMLVLLIMAIGLGLPALLTLSGGIFLCARRFTKRKDELSLER